MLRAMEVFHCSCWWRLYKAQPPRTRGREGSSVSYYWPTGPVRETYLLAKDIVERARETETQTSWRDGEKRAPADVD